MKAVAKLDEIMLKLQSTSLFTPVTESPPAVIIPAKTSYRRSVFTIRLNTPPSTIASSDNQIAMSHIPTPPSVNDTKDSHDTKTVASNLKKSTYTTAQAAVKLINVYGQEIRIPVLSGAPCVAKWRRGQNSIGRTARMGGGIEKRRTTSASRRSSRHFEEPSPKEYKFPLYFAAMLNTLKHAEA
ncbi:hypothetical protein HDU78_000320 [Chytriomyces hyalinus]|nr:hypothetical protein HDU78_000320 [Chytriomyces hyalinus]